MSWKAEIYLFKGPHLAVSYTQERNQKHAQALIADRYSLMQIQHGTAPLSTKEENLQ